MIYLDLLHLFALFTLFNAFCGVWYVLIATSLQVLAGPSHPVEYVTETEEPPVQEPIQTAT